VKVNDLSDLFARNSVTMQDLEGKCLAVDMKCWFDQFSTTEDKKEESKSLTTSLRRILKLLFHNIRPVFVFSAISSYQQSSHGTKAPKVLVIEKLKERVLGLVQVFDLPYIICDNVNAQCGYLVQSGGVSGIITDDIMISLLFGGSVLYKYLFNDLAHATEIYSITQIEKTLHLTRNDFIRLAYLLGSTGSDNINNHEGIVGMGERTALEIIDIFSDKDKGEANEVQESLDQILACLNNWKNWVTQDEDENQMAPEKREKYVRIT
jgi:5'-3' exonuclease